MDPGSHEENPEAKSLIRHKLLDWSPRDGKTPTSEKINGVLGVKYDVGYIDYYAVWRSVPDVELWTRWAYWEKVWKRTR